MGDIGETSIMVTAASAILTALEDAGITHLFVNLGSDHPAFLSAFASKQHGLKICTSPNEMNALSAASGYAQITGKPAAVLVHVECGTQALAGAVHNISKGRVPAIILAGTVPITQEGELKGSRNEYIHWIQDVPNQRAIVAQYMRYEHEIRSAHNATQLVLRAVQFSTSSPQGPSYLIAARETLEQVIPSPKANPTASGSQSYVKTQPLEPLGLSPAAISCLTDALLKAQRPLIITSYCGRSHEGFNALRTLAELCVVPVHENAPVYNNFPTTSYLHQGHQWNGGGQLPALAEADVVLVIDADVPWISAQSKPSPSARVFHMDVDPLKEGTTLWYLPCEKRWKCDSALALQQLADSIRLSEFFSSIGVRQRLSSRREFLSQRFEARQQRLSQAEVTQPASRLTVPFFMSRLREATKDLRVVGLNESTTNLGNVADFLHHDRALSLIGSGGGALGWYSGAAVGASLALQEQGRGNELVVAFTGDGTWLFGVPSCAYWMAKKYNTPFLTIIWNNGGWASPKNACLRVHPEVQSKPGFNSTELSSDLMVAIDPSPAFGKIAEGAGDAWWAVARTYDEVDGVCQTAIKVVQEERRSAVVEVVINKI